MTMAPTSSADLLGLARDAGRGIDEVFTTTPFMKAVAQIEQDNGPEQRSRMLREMLRDLAAENRDKIDSLNYPESVHGMIHTEFDRIEKQCDEKEDDWFDLERFSLRCDFRNLCFGRVPVGPQHLEIGGLPKSLLVRGGIAQAFRFLNTSRRAGGVEPFYVLHLACNIWPPAFRLVYSHEAQLNMFRLLAECMEMNPQVRGVQSCGWLFDPQLDTASPKLAYLRKDWIDNGGKLFRWQIDEATTRMATKNSPHRQALYDEGKFRPYSHMVVFARPALLAWAQQNPPNDSTAESTA